MPKSAPYAGRHRGRHRAAVVRPSRGVTLPGAATAALTLTATGAAVVPGLTGAAVASGLPEPSPAPRTASTASMDAVILSARSQIAAAELLQEARAAREQLQQRATRARQRAALEKKRKDALATSRRWVSPVQDYRLSSQFGPRWGRLHAGNDLAAPTGTRIGALSSGTVIFAGQQSGYGNKVEVRHWDGTVSCYAHMSSVSVTVGTEVSPGEQLGTVGSTGHSTGPHLHLEIHPDGGGPVNPASWLAARGLTL